MFKRKLSQIIIIIAGFLFLTALPNMIVQASPASPNSFVVIQPDGTTFTAVQWGDEYQHGLETVEGYSIAQENSSGYWYYLSVGLDGTLAPAMQNSTLMIVGQDSPKGLKKHLRPSVTASAKSSTKSPAVVGATDSPTASGTQKVVVFLAGFPNATGRSAPSDWASLIFGGAGSLKITTRLYPMVLFPLNLSAKRVAQPMMALSAGWI